MQVFLKPITIDDAEFVSQVRNHQDTIRYLHDQRTFTIDETRKWLQTTNPYWFIILNNHNIKVGYIRTSDVDKLNWTIKIGCDIHPDHRCQDYATAAYTVLFNELIQQGYDKVWLEVLDNNYRAINLYEKLGFQYVQNLQQYANIADNSIVMHRRLCPSTGRAVKVIVTYFGNRRDKPPNAKETYDLLKFNIHQEQTLDQGVDYDTLFVYNMIMDKMDNESEEWINKCESLLREINHTKSKNGNFKLLVRPNVGLSFAAYNAAFLKYMVDYDYWFFTEDDYIVIKERTYKRALEQLYYYKYQAFIGIVGVSTHFCFPPHVGGGVGITTREVLRDVLRHNRSDDFPNGCLPHHVNTYNNYENQEWLGEIRFTNVIHQLGYRLINHDWIDIVGAWERESRRNARAININKNYHKV